MKNAWIVLAVVLSIALQTTLARFLAGGNVFVDFVLVVVVYTAIVAGPVAGMVTGSAAGLVQDTLSSGIIGVGGLAKAIVGFVAGVLAQQFIVTATLPRAVLFVGSTALHAVIFIGMYALLGQRSFPPPLAETGGQALGNMAIGVVAFSVIEAVPGIIERRRRLGRLRR